MSVTVRGLRAIGTDASGIVVYGASPIRDDEGVELMTRVASRRSLYWAADVAPGLPRFLRAIREADVLHWHMSAGLPFGLDLRYAAMLGKPAVVEFAGSEIRKPSVEAATNPYYAAVRDRYEYREWETDEGSRQTQRRFGRARCEALVSDPGLLDSIERGWFPHVHVVRQRVMTSDFEPKYPDPANKRPLVVHASTASVGKGTAAVVAAANELRGRVDFELALLEQAPRAEALELIGRADVYLDQFVIGAHGTAAVEAMALGKPVVGFVKPSVASAYPADLPLVNATQEALPAVLEGLLTNGARRHELGRSSRAYVEAHHDAVHLAVQLRDLYSDVIDRRSS